MKRFDIKKLICILLIVPVCFVISCGKKISTYGVYQWAEPEDVKDIPEYDVLIIDAQNFSKEEIKALRANTVYSYLNVGSIEDFRSYFSDYLNLSMAEYENWPGEYWVDVSDDKWQNFILNELAPSLVAKGVDGFFIDNCDVYYLYENEGIYKGLVKILTELKATGLHVIINGGDSFVSRFIEENNSLSSIADGINQESVFSKINWEDSSFAESDKEDREYYFEYLKNVSDVGAKVYIMEYTTDEKLVSEVSNYCEEKGYLYFISNRL